MSRGMAPNVLHRPMGYARRGVPVHFLAPSRFSAPTRCLSARRQEHSHARQRSEASSPPEPSIAAETRRIRVGSQC